MLRPARPLSSDRQTIAMRFKGRGAREGTVLGTTGTLRRVSKSLEGSTAVQGGSCLFVSHRSVESSEIENYYSP